MSANNIGGIEMKYRTWECKIVVPIDSQLPEGFDLPPRRAAMNAVSMAGVPILACFSGWGGKLTKTQDKIVDESREALNKDKL